MSEQSLQTQNNFLGILDKSINRVFKAEDVKAKDGVTVIGVNLVPMKRKDIAKNMDLVGKDNKDALDQAILDERDGLMRFIKGEVAKLGPEWTASRSRIVTSKNGTGHRVMTLKFEEIKRGHKGDSAETIAAKLGLPVEKVLEMIERQSNANKPVDVPATSTQSKAENPATGTQDAPEPIVT